MAERFMRGKRVKWLGRSEGTDIAVAYFSKSRPINVRGFHTTYGLHRSPERIPRSNGAETANSLPRNNPGISRTCVAIGLSLVHSSVLTEHPSLHICSHITVTIKVPRALPLSRFCTFSSERSTIDMDQWVGTDMCSFVNRIIFDQYMTNLRKGQCSSESQKLSY